MSKRDLEAEIDKFKEQVNILETRISSIVDVLESKGMMTSEEWEKKIKQNLSI